MNGKNGNRLERSKADKLTVEQDKTLRSAKYNYSGMRAETVNNRNGFQKRLVELRMKRGKSGREMSLSLGQGAGYINNIENGKNLPSMAMFFEICEYLDVSPNEFFSYAEEDADRKKKALAEEIRKLNAEDADLVLSVIRRIRKEQ